MVVCGVGSSVDDDGSGDGADGDRWCVCRLGY